ncbi:MAG: dTDP-4-dehydrorhamnose reductase [Aurantibacter sp.]
MTKVLVTGGNGQLASCIKDVAGGLPGHDFTYIDLDELDITDKEAVDSFFEDYIPHWCINCAAYTAVDKAESEQEIAKKVNVDGARYLAEASKKRNARFVQLSTDFVFDGMQSSIYSETDKTAPLSVYGSTKLEGELAVADANPEHFVIRTSWLYSEYGHNFLKTMLRLGSERDTLNVVSDQIGTPTYAGDLAALIFKILKTDSPVYGLYHYSNEGVASWYDFAKAIMDESETECEVLPIKTEAYPTPAKRPTFSVMDKSKIKNTLNIEIPYWRDSLKKAIQLIYENK